MARKEKLKPADVAAALRANSGLVYLTADKLGVCVQTIYNYANKYSAVKDAIAHEKGKRLDTAEASLWKAVLGGEAWAVCFYLKTQGKARGYVERQEVKNVSDSDIDRAIDLELARVGHGGQAAAPGPAEDEDEPAE